METMHKPSRHGFCYWTLKPVAVKRFLLLPHLNISHTRFDRKFYAKILLEINLPGINQVNVHPQIGLGFTECLRAFYVKILTLSWWVRSVTLETAENCIKSCADRSYGCFDILRYQSLHRKRDRLAKDGCSRL